VAQSLVRARRPVWRKRAEGARVPERFPVRDARSLPESQWPLTPPRQAPANVGQVRQLRRHYPCAAPLQPAQPSMVRELHRDAQALQAPLAESGRGGVVPPRRAWREPEHRPHALPPRSSLALQAMESLERAKLEVKQSSGDEAAAFLRDAPAQKTRSLAEQASSVPVAYARPLGPTER